MKASLLLVFIFLLFPLLPAQSEAARKLVDEGVELHDLGNYAGAVAKYNAALEMEEGDYFIAAAEKATTLFFMEEFEACIELSEGLIKRYPREDALSQVYTTLGNALDLLGKPEEAIDTYERAIARFPEDYMLRFNLGVTYLRKGETERGKKNLIAGINTYPYHPGSHFALGITLAAENKRTPAILALLRFFLLEIGTQRSFQAYETLCVLLEGNIQEKSRKSVNISMNPDAMEEDGSPDNFYFPDFKLDWEANMAQGKKFRKLARKMNTVELRTEQVWSILQTSVNMMDEGKLKGPLTDLYIPFFKELEERGYLETLMYLAHADSGERYAKKWLEDHFEEVKSLLDWAFGEGEGKN